MEGDAFDVSFGKSNEPEEKPIAKRKKKRK